MKNTEFQVIFIMLGEECNFKCTYCMQGDHKTHVIQPEISDEFLNYLDNYKSENKTSLCFWGGEPLLYFPAIKNIAERFQNKFQYEMVSNGSLLTQEIVDFLNLYSFRFCLSHDGEITEQTRKVDVLKNEKIANLFYQIKDRVVNVTYSSISPKIEEIIQSYPEGQVITLNTIINTTDTELSRMYADFDIEKYKEDIRYLLSSYEEYIAGNDTKKREYINVCRMIKSLKVYLKEGRQANRCYDCGNGSKMLNVDTKGNLYMCHNSRVYIGTVDDQWDKIQENINIVLSKSQKKCKTCDFNKVCGGNCMLLSGAGEAQKCKLSRIFYSIFIPWVMKMQEQIKNEGINK